MDISPFVLSHSGMWRHMMWLCGCVASHLAGKLVGQRNAQSRSGMDNGTPHS